MSEPTKSSVSAPENTEPKEPEPKEPDRGEAEAQRPVGAILVTSFLALMILISWFGMYFLDFLRG